MVKLWELEFLAALQLIKKLDIFVLKVHIVETTDHDRMDCHANLMPLPKELDPN